MGSHDPFGHFKHKLWPKEWLGVKLSRIAHICYFQMIMGFIMFKESKLLDPKKTKVIVNILIPINPQLI